MGKGRRHSQQNLLTAAFMPHGLWLWCKASHEAVPKTWHIVTLESPWKYDISWAFQWNKAVSTKSEVSDAVPYNHDGLFCITHRNSRTKRNKYGYRCHAFYTPLEISPMHAKYNDGIKAELQWCFIRCCCMIPELILTVFAKLSLPTKHV